MKLKKKAQNLLNLLILVMLVEKKLHLGKIENFKGSINPYSPTVLIRGRKNYIVLQNSISKTEEN